jgi:hypothetical protein
VWWTWFGPDYVPLIIDHLPPAQIQAVGDGVFHTRSAEPWDRDQLRAAFAAPTPAKSPRRSFRRLFEGRAKIPEGEQPQLWLPRELLGNVDADDLDNYVPRLIPATLMPPTLRPEP